jgi:very-short-patch-repair endonuclease
MKKGRKSITELAMELRRNPTESEKILWQYLRKRKLKGCRFVRQKLFVYKQYNSKSYFFILTSTVLKRS